MPPAPAARAKVLHAFAELLVTSGERSATLDAIADSAGVSKGGLLYHFPTRDALVDGLVEHLHTLIAADVATMESAPEGPVAYLLRSSLDVGGELDLAFRGVSQLAQGSAPHARSALDTAHDTWTRAIATQVEDPATAHAIMLISDGLYHRSSIGAQSPDLDELLRIVDRLVATQPSRAR
ncbi:TetR/AcrR family transcriptional regulator [Isoptericola sp. S6320L]|uniref:TetR/AcrR family transcriptional regulator n=1 Tax=Isoptericola sp. S6320L TaxID=2926411 RepID=UPI001FF5E53A|nr:TetR/AcrR family transcriptional regulator [Isoptericola sp. S6320L]MCK0117732.1 TetR/AcrR family transcriptional regulator [Isoptericola sp. S6320L]